MNYWWNISTFPTSETPLHVSINTDIGIEEGDFIISDASDIAAALTTLVHNVLNNDLFEAIENNTVIFVINDSGSLYGEVIIDTVHYQVSISDRYQFVNNEYAVAINRSESLSWQIDSQVWSEFVSFCPEFYVVCDAQLEALSMVTYKNGIPFFHNLQTTTTYNKFYTFQCDQIISICINEGITTEKRFLTFAVDSKNKTSSITGTKYQIYKIETSDNQESNLPMAAFIFKENFLWAALMRATNLGGTLQTGQQLRGVWLNAVLVRDSSEGVVDQYSEFAKATGTFFTSEYAIKK